MRSISSCVGSPHQGASASRRNSEPAVERLHARRRPEIWAGLIENLGRVFWYSASSERYSAFWCWRSQPDQGSPVIVVWNLGH